MNINSVKKLQEHSRFSCRLWTQECVHSFCYLKLILNLASAPETDPHVTQGTPSICPSVKYTPSLSLFWCLILGTFISTLACLFCKYFWYFPLPGSCYCEVCWKEFQQQLLVRCHHSSFLLLCLFFWRWFFCVSWFSSLVQEERVEVTRRQTESK